ncbi:MAG: hypothetical protein DIJKHBIC_02297 [Thermoanaerobaculia bacterium]|nr:hypothetical protein [Thermoanaerobaculia bacterium]
MQLRNGENLKLPSYQFQAIERLDIAIDDNHGELIIIRTDTVPPALLVLASYTFSIGILEIVEGRNAR